MMNVLIFVTLYVFCNYFLIKNLDKQFSYLDYQDLPG